MVTTEIKKKDARGLLLVLFLGQLLAFSMAAASFTSSFLANLVVKAYQYSSITSVTLLDCWTVVWVIILTRYALGTRYSFWQFLGAGTCVAGLALVLLSDAKSPDEQDPGQMPLLGDALVIAGTVCFAFSNVGEISSFAGYAIAIFTFTSISPFVLKWQQINWLYYVAFSVVAIGLIVYSLNESSPVDGTAKGTEAAAHYQQLPSEDSSTSGSNLDSQENKQLEAAHIC
ncbi:unnamed protein product [Triticum turgidum subsp. durum]|uniref:Uncharacterized protein n=1 Tax=Triticum turgidum subsp. durum TaxID=4567 RepID=A0A9R0QA95_TRITD|nr:unnamed protein product [Triticum turgidum subsp. durum]